MARPEVTGRKTEVTGGISKKQPRNRGPPIPAHAFTVIEFCTAHRISRARYYELKNEGLAPVEMVVGRRRLISHEAAEQWRRQREAAAAQTAA